MRRAWSALLFFAVAVIVLQVAAAAIQPYVPTIVLMLAIVFVLWSIAIILCFFRNKKRIF